MNYKYVCRSAQLLIQGSTAIILLPPSSSSPFGLQYSGWDVSLSGDDVNEDIALSHGRKNELQMCNAQLLNDHLNSAAKRSPTALQYSGGVTVILRLEMNYRWSKLKYFFLGH